MVLNEVKKLPRTQICTLFEIGSPIWNGKAKKRMVGLALNRVRKHNEIHFTYRRKRDGQLSIPDAYYFDGNLMKGLDYEVMNRYGTTLVLIPFSDLQILQRVDEVKPEEPKGEPLSNKPLPRNDPRWYRHTTHYACAERLQAFGGQTRGCCCVGHECKEDKQELEQGSLL